MIALVFRKPWAFLKRDIITESSYKLSFASQLFGIVISVLTFFFLGKLIEGSPVTSYLAPYNGDYFSFVLIGIAFSDLMMTAVSIFEGRVREGQVNGTLEPLLMTPTSLPVILVSSSLYGFLLSCLRAVLYLVIGAVFFGANFNAQGIFLSVIIIIISLINFSAIGLLGASFILVFKKGNPFSWIFSSVSELLGGVLYPIAVLPPVFQFISKFLPITYSLNSMRAVLIQGKPVNAIIGDVLILSIMSAVLLFFAFISFKVAIKKVKADGSLAHF